jgi:hypothetical protein
MTTAFQSNAFQNNAFQIVLIPPTPSGKNGGDDAPWTREELRRYKDIQKKLRQAEEKRIAALKADAENRKQTIADLVNPPVAKKQQTKVQSNQEVSVDIPSNLANIDRYIANLVKQQQDLQTAVAMRAAKLRLEQELAVLEAKRQAELDDEEALLALIL